MKRFAIRISQTPLKKVSHKAVLAYKERSLDFQERRDISVDILMYLTQGASVGVGRQQYAGVSVVTDATQQNFKRLQFSSYRDIIDHEPSYIIGKLYCENGQNFIDYLDGNFSILIWDSNRQELSGYIDRTGVRPLYIYNSRDDFVIGNHFPTVYSFGSAGADLNYSSIKNFISNQRVETYETFFNQISRMPPAGRINWSRNGVTVDRYWCLPQQRSLAARTPEKWISYFREEFECAVDAAIPATGRTASLLSGGLDSSSVSAVAARKLANCTRKFKVYSIDLNLDPENREREFQDLVVSRYNMRQTILQDSESNYLDGLGCVLHEIGGPVFAPGLLPVQRLYKRAHLDGILCLLDGHGGDETVSYGFGLVKQLMVENKPISALRQVIPFGLNPVLNAIYGFGRYHTWAGRAVAATGNRVRRAFSSGLILSNDDSPNDVITEALSNVEDLRPDQSVLEILGRPVSTEFEDHYRTLTTTGQSVALQAIYQHGRSEGVEMQFPLWNARFVQMALSVPPELKLCKGVDRWIFRSAMQHILPERVRLRTSKSTFNRSLAIAFSGRDNTFLRDMLSSNRHFTQDFINGVKFDKLLNILTQQGPVTDGYTVQTIWRVAALGDWLRACALDQYPTRGCRLVAINVQ